MVTDKQLYQDALQIFEEQLPKYMEPVECTVSGQGKREVNSEDVFEIQARVTLPENVEIEGERGRTELLEEVVDELLTTNDFSNNQWSISSRARGGPHSIHIGKNVSRRL
jgi:hypothetical protein